MKNLTFLLVTIFISTSWANETPNPVKFKRQDSDHIKEVMTAWNKEKGEYLYESMASLIMHQQQPERPKNLNQTSFELLRLMGDQRLDRIERIASDELENERNATKRKRDKYYWEEWIRYLRTSRCNSSSGSSNGDPHITTFDGVKYDFQNAGDYLLAASEDNTFMVQTQMVRASNNTNISQNGGVVMNVNGDILEFRRMDAVEKNKMIYINNEEMPIEESDLILPQGGVVIYEKKKYIVKWPTGEQATIRTRGSKGNKKFDVFIKVPECRDDYYGLLGDNDGVKENDLFAHDQETGKEVRPDRVPNTYEDLFGANRRNPEVKARQTKNLQFISYSFGDRFMLDPKTSLFTSQMADIPDSVRYPQKHFTLAELSDEQIEEGLRKAKEAGVAEEDLFGAIYDYGHIGLEPMAHVNDDFIKRVVKDNEPVIDSDENDRKGNSSPQTIINPRVFIGTGVQVSPPRNNQPIYTKPRPNSRPSRSTPGTNVQGRPTGGTPSPTRNLR